MFSLEFSERKAYTSGLVRMRTQRRSAYVTAGARQVAIGGGPVTVVLVAVVCGKPA